MNMEKIADTAAKKKKSQTVYISTEREKKGKDIRSTSRETG